MPPGFCFFNDFDSFTLEPDYLEIVYGNNRFRFGYANDRGNRKFSFKSTGKLEIILPGMLLQSENDGGFRAVYAVNIYAHFDDVLKFSEFVGKLARVAGYQQVQVPNPESSTNLAFNSEESDENEDELDPSDNEEPIFKQHHIVDSVLEMAVRPTVQYVEVQPLVYNFTPTYFEVTHPETQNTWRFLHAANRVYQLNPGCRPANKRNRNKYVLLDVMLQAQHDHAVCGCRGRCSGYVDVGPCHVEFDLPVTTMLALSDQFTPNGYTAIVG